jgi:hypothetical protein
VVPGAGRSSSVMLTRAVGDRVISCASVSTRTPEEVTSPLPSRNPAENTCASPTEGTSLMTRVWGVGERRRAYPNPRVVAGGWTMDMHWSQGLGFDGERGRGSHWTMDMHWSQGLGFDGERGRGSHRGRARAQLLGQLVGLPRPGYGRLEVTVSKRGNKASC